MFIGSIIISILTILALIAAILFKPTIKIKSLELQTFWLIALLGAILLISFRMIPISFLFKSLTESSSVNPLKILILFISISFLSIVLDELGFFNFISVKAINLVKNSQWSLFFIIYFLVATLTIFTSNDIVILTFTPFICYFAKKGKINPIPYLVMEFINANTYSMLLSIGNPTNIYLSSSFNVSFLTYFVKMLLPTIFASLASLLMLVLLFRRDLNKPISTIRIEEIPLKNKKLIIINLIHLALTTILLAISNYINLEMWLVALVCASSLLIFVIIHTIREHDSLAKYTIKRLPFNLIPFLISMFTIVLCLNYQGVILKISSLFIKLSNSKAQTSLTYLISSTLACNLINNIPMTIFFSNIINCANPLYLNNAIYATIVGSNIGAYLTPIGALAGIMWMSILKKQDIKYNFLSFIKYGIIIVPVVMIFTYLGLILI